MYTSVLIANRGEIAVRIARTAHRLGMRVIAIASAADRDSLHVRAADEVKVMDGADPRRVYLDIAAVLAVAAETGAECIHPGYGFLAENPEFAEACVKAGLSFVGPPAAAIRAMGLKDSAKRLMADAGVPLAPGYQGENQEAEFLAGRALEIGFPVMLKAIAGGGGKGMRRVAAAGDFAAALDACKREALASFGDDRVLIEKYVPGARHIEVQVLADMHGNCIHLLERECSLQRRHQKIIEEAPVPGMSMALRRNMGEAAVKGAKAAGYVGAGTVEFITAADLSSFYFMEMNTRLQVEHPVTEMVTGVDLVELQFRVAAGERLPLQQAEIYPRGHAIEARLYAEDPAHDFLPQTGKLFRLRWPPESAELRIDTGVEQGNVITPFYDPMIAKLIAHGKNRREAINRLSAALLQTCLVGVRTNQWFLRQLLKDRQVVAGGVTTDFIDNHFAKQVGHVPLQAKVEAAAAWLAATTRPSGDIWNSGRWSLTGLPRKDIVSLSINGESLTFDVSDGEDGTVSLAYGGHSFRAGGTATWHFDESGGKLYLTHEGAQLEVTEADHLAHGPAELEGAPVARAPMNGKIIRVFKLPGEHVSRGDPLLVIEAMKMEHIIRAGIDGIVSVIYASEGSTVPEGMPLCALDPVTSSEGT